MHYTWEQMSPVPLNGSDTSEPALRVDRKTRYLGNKKRMDFFLGAKIYIIEILLCCIYLITKRIHISYTYIHKYIYT